MRICVHVYLCAGVFACVHVCVHTRRDVRASRDIYRSIEHLARVIFEGHENDGVSLASAHRLQVVQVCGRLLAVLHL
jgi:hypothetical protein